MRKMFAALARSASSALSLFQPPGADDVYLNDGNHLTGTVTTIEAGNLTLHLSGAG